MKTSIITALAVFSWSHAVSGVQIPRGGSNRCALRNKKLLNSPELEVLLADCSSFLVNTAAPATVTTTKTSLATTTALTATTTFTTSTFTTTVTSPRKRGAPPPAHARIPKYAAALCPDSAAYRSACSCLGVTARTTTAGPAPTATSLTTSTATVTQTSTATSVAVFTAVVNTCTPNGSSCDLNDPGACCSYICCNRVQQEGGPYCCGGFMV
ncbi:hypothetical protein ACKVWC_005519 [Pyricularia oryzae]